MEEDKFQQYCIVELFGRQVLAGLVSEQVIGGTSFIRVDVPAIDGVPAFTRFYGSGAIYAITPVSLEVALAALRHARPNPVNVYIPELRQRQIPAQLAEDDQEDSDDSPF